MTGSRSNRRGRPLFRPSNSRRTSSSNSSKQNASEANGNISTLRIADENGEGKKRSFPVATTQKKSGKKRKSSKPSTGVAIGSSRPLQEREEPPSSGSGDIIHHHSTALEPNVPTAPPGQPSLQAFCSKYRTKEKREKPQTHSAPPAVVNDAPVEAASNGPVVQVVNGEIVLQESSMVAPGARRSVQEVEEEFQHVVEEETHSAVVGASYNSFVSRKAPQHWKVEETKMFYSALRQVGMDFGTMTAFFENRTRKQLKRKFHVESIKKPHLIALALDPKSKVPLDLSVFNVQVQNSSTSNDETAHVDKKSNEEELPVALPPSSEIGSLPVPVGVALDQGEELIEWGDNDDEEHDTAFQEEQNAGIEPHEAIPVSLPAVAPARAANGSRSKRPKFRASKMKSRRK